MSDRMVSTKDVLFKPAGVGHNPARMCLGCNVPRMQQGSTGQGLRWRCVHCVTARAANLCGGIR